MDLMDELAVFVRTARAGSLSKAARELGHSVASVSKRLDGLESRLGARLFNRSTRGLALTDEGADVLDRAQRLLDDGEALVGLFRDTGASVRGTLRVGAPSRFGERYVAPVVTRFIADHPEARVELHLTDRHQDLIAEGLDLAVRIGPLADSHYVMRPLARASRLLVAAPSYLDRAGRPQRPEELERHDCLVLEDNDRWQLTRAGESLSVRVLPRVRCRHGDALTALCRGGAGIALKSAWDVTDELDAGRLERLLAEWRVTGSADISLLLPHRRFVPPRVRRFIECLRAGLGDPPPWLQDA